MYTICAIPDGCISEDSELWLRLQVSSLNSRWDCSILLWQLIKALEIVIEASLYGACIIVDLIFSLHNLGVHNPVVFFTFLAFFQFSLSTSLKCR